ncbi:AlpA family phage regulatory protein [Burkholderia oklahomensis]
MPSQINDPATPAEHRILRRAEVEARTGFKRAHIYSCSPASGKHR